MGTTRIKIADIARKHGWNHQDVMAKARRRKIKPTRDRDGQLSVTRRQYEHITSRMPAGRKRTRKGNTHG